MNSEKTRLKKALLVPFLYGHSDDMYRETKQFVGYLKSVLCSKDSFDGRG